jgi:hypothetical protein
MTRRTVLVGLVWAITAGGAALLTTTAVMTTVVAAAGVWLVVFVALGADVLVFASIGAILALRRPNNVVGIVLIVSGPLIVVTFFGFLLGAQLTDVRGPDDALAGLASVVASLTIYPTLIIVGPVLALLFPDGRLPGRRWRWPVAAIGCALVLGTLMTMIRPGPLNVGLANNPFGMRGTAWVDPISTIGAALAALTLPAALLVAVAGLASKFRRARPVEREQLKWFVAANAITVVLLLGQASDPAPDATWFDVFGIAGISLPPLAVGIAILRYRLYDIDRLISRTVSWAVTSSLLVSVFAGAVVSMQAVLIGFTQGQTLAVAGSTLVAYAIFQPLRRRVQSAVDRRFDRARYDAQRTVDTFTEHLRNEVDLARLRVALVATADDAVRPISATVWLRAGSGGSR